jgi:5-methylthioadenosine/S-adenosylhomocysteine deaminase
VLRDGAVAVRDGRVIAVDDAGALERCFRPERRVDAAGGLILPGLIDVHLHHSQQLSRGLGDDVSLVSWVYDRILPYEAAMDERDTEISALLSCIEMIRTGTTCASDPGGYHVDAVGRAVEATGMRAIIAWAGMDRWPADRPVPDALPGKLPTEATLEVLESTASRWHHVAGDRIRVAYGLRTEPNVSDELFARTKALADRDETFIHIHIAVSQQQVAWMRERTGRSSIGHLASLGVLDANWLLAHVAAIDDHDVELIAAADARIAHQPGASTHGCYGAIAHGRIPELLEAGVTVGLGCDANSANNSLDMFRAINLAATLHKEARLDPRLVSPERALEMATIDAARAIHWEDELGSLEVGKAADLIVVDTSGPNWVPVHDFSLVPTLAYSGQGTDVTTTIVDGQVLMEDRELTTIDVATVLTEAQQRAEQLLERLPYRLRPAWPLRQHGTARR